MKKTVCTTLLLALWVIPADLAAQMQRERVVANRPVELAFPASRHIQLFTTEPLARRELYYSIMHSFGRMESGITDFWGLDQGANIRFSIEYGLSDRFSAFLGRSSMDKVYETGFRYHLIRQMIGRGSPVSVTLAVTGGLMTEDFSWAGEEYGFGERLSLAVSLPVSRKFNDQFSLMLSPMAASLNATTPLMQLRDADEEHYAGLGMGSRVKYSSRGSVTLQYVPVAGVSDRKVHHQVGIGLDLETGGHVFQLFFTNAQALNDVWLLAGRSGDIGLSHLRFGFNVNRSFQL